MKSDLLSIIKNDYADFSKSQKLIADFVLNNYDKAAFMTAARLGTAIGISESTVVRFACFLGYDGYPSFQKALQEIARSRLNNIQRMDLYFDRIGDNIISNVLESDIARIRQTIDEVSEEDFNRAADAIINAENIYIIGTRSSSVLASFLHYYFGLIFENVHLVSSGSANGLYEQIFRIKNGDIMIGISFPRYSKTTIKALEFARDNGADTLAVTDSMLSPIAGRANHIILARSDMASFVDSLVAPLSILNALIAAISIKKHSETAESFKILESIWEKYDVYEKSGES